MTELEKIEYAKSFIDKLANGINPIDNRPAPENDIINNVRLSRCFFYVSDILRQVIENGGVQAPKNKKEKKEPFSITQEQLQQYQYTKGRISLSEFCDKLNAMIDTEHMISLRYNKIAPYLLQKGFLHETECQDGKYRKLPTEQGNEIGIFTEVRTTPYGIYEVAAYNAEAQRFLIEHLEEILQSNN